MRICNNMKSLLGAPVDLGGNDNAGPFIVPAVEDLPEFSLCTRT